MGAGVLIHEDNGLEHVPPHVLPPDVLPAGPLYAVSVGCGATLYYTTSGFGSAAQVNEAASMAANQTIRGDAYLVSPTAGLYDICSHLRLRGAPIKGALTGVPAWHHPCPVPGARPTDTDPSRSACTAVQAAPPPSATAAALRTVRSNERCETAQCTLSSILQSKNAGGAVSRRRSMEHRACRQHGGAVADSGTSSVRQRASVQPSPARAADSSSPTACPEWPAMPPCSQHGPLDDGCRLEQEVHAPPAMQPPALTAVRMLDGGAAQERCAVGLHPPLQVQRAVGSVVISGQQQAQDDSRMGGGGPHARSSSSTARDMQPDSPMSPSPWEQLPVDILSNVLAALPAEASQVLSFAAVSTAWRHAVLSHEPTLRRIAFRLDPHHPLRAHAPRMQATAGVPSARRASCGTAPQAAVMSTPPALGGGAAQARSSLDGVAQSTAAQAGRRSFGLPRLLVTPRTYLVQRYRLDGTRLVAEEPAAPAAQGAVSRAQLESIPRLVHVAAGAGNRSAQLVLAQLTEVAGDGEGCMRWWRKLARADGDVEALFKVGLASYHGSHGMPMDAEAAHMWLSRVLKQLLQPDALASAGVGQQQRNAGGAGTAAGVESGRALASGSAAARLPPALAAQVAALSPPLRHMLGWSAMVSGYLAFDGEVGGGGWGTPDRSEAVRMFQLAAGCGCAEADEVLGWMFNTGQY